MTHHCQAIFHQSGGRPAARYASAETVYEEALEHGRLVGLYWSASGQVQRENTSAELPGFDATRLPLHTFELEVDGQSLHNRWDWAAACQRAGKRPDTIEAVIELHHQARPVTVRVVTRLDGTSVLVRYLEITNTGTQPAALAHVAPLAGRLWTTQIAGFQPPGQANPSYNSQLQSKFTLGYLKHENALEEGDFIWQPLPQESFRIERKSHGRSWGSPYYILKNQASGEMFFIGLAWSGNYYAEFTNRPEEQLFFRLGPLAPAPLRVIAPGETVRSPEVHLGLFHTAFDQAVGYWHQHLRASVVPPRPAGKEMYTVAGRVVEEPGEWILREVDIAAQMGVEAFMVDAGWYGNKFANWPAQRGDWQEGDWLPGGLAGIREYAHQRGLLFGLWHEAEAISNQSQLHQQHPEWALHTDDGRPCAETLDLANPSAAAFFEENVIRLIRDHHLDFYKLDYNVSVGEGGQSLRDGFAESEFWRHYEVVYRIYERVRREFPDVCLENCAGGGGRNDLGMLARFHYACESDWSVMPYSIRAINALTLFIPPEALCYYHNHVNWMGVQAHQLADADTHLRVTLFATPIFVGFGAQNPDCSGAFFQKTRRYIELHKGFCRPVLAGKPLVYHHTPDIGLFSPAEWCVLEYSQPGRERGYAGVFKLGNQQTEYILRLRGIDLGREYLITLDNHPTTFQIPGRELSIHGLPIHLDAPLTSELVLYQACG